MNNVEIKEEDLTIKIECETKLEILQIKQLVDTIKNLRGSIAEIIQENEM